MLQSMYRLFIELSNGKWTSLCLQKFAQSKWSRRIIPSFAKIYGINQAEMAQSMEEFPTLHDFFIRKLRDEARTIDQEENTVVSPVDAVLEDTGKITANVNLVIKGKNYSLVDMLGSKEKAKRYENGTYMLLYLSPSHYHRIHSPVSGRIMEKWTLGRKSYPVNAYGLKYGKDTLSKNYRMITEVEHVCGHVAIVKVGAMFVNSIETTFKGEHLKKGEEMAYFTFGSTVILLFDESSLLPTSKYQTPREIKMGEVVGMLNTL